MTRSWLLSSWLGVSVALVWCLHLLVFYWHALASWQLSYALTLLQGFVLAYQACCRAISSAPPASAVYCCNLCVRIYMCLQFYSAQCSGHLAQCCSALVFFPSLPSLIIIIISSSSSIVLISPLNSWFSVTGAWAGAGCGGRGSKQGCRQDYGVFLLPGLVVGGSSPQVPSHPTFHVRLWH